MSIAHMVFVCGMAILLVVSHFVEGRVEVQTHVAFFDHFVGRDMAGFVWV